MHKFNNGHDRYLHRNTLYKMDNDVCIQTSYCQKGGDDIWNERHYIFVMKLVY